MNSHLEGQVKEIKALREKLITKEEEYDDTSPPPPVKSETNLRFQKLKELVHSILALKIQAHSHDIVDLELREKLPKR